MAPSKVLAIKLRSMGDTLLMTAPVIELAHAFPQAEIDMVISEDWASLLKGFPGIRQIWTVPQTNNTLSRIRKLTCLAVSLRKEKYDCVVNFHASPSSSKLSFATGAKCRSIHFHGHEDRNFFSTVTIPGKGILKPIIERDMDTVRALGAHIPAGRMPKIFLQATELSEARHFLNQLNIPQPVLGMFLGASRPTKSWPIARFASLAVEWCRKEKGGVLALAGPSEGQLIHDFLLEVDELLAANFENIATRAQIRTRIVANHEISLRKLAAVLSQVSVLATNDSGPKHVAVAVDTPTVTVFGPEHPFEWHPYPQDRHPYLFVDRLPCRKDADPGMRPWCGLQECKTEEHKCMQLIGVDTVLSQCQRVAKR